MANHTSVSLIITTYNWKEALQLVLISVTKQSITPNEIIIADDGSREDSAQLINEFRNRTSIPIVHIWQEDIGFRAAMSRNKAIAAAKYPYIVAIDGDIIVLPKFIEDHITIAEHGKFVFGKRVMISKDKSARLIENKETSIYFFTDGIKNRKNTLNNSFLHSTFSKKTNSLKGIKTCNIGFWREDAININGFNEKFNGWGREDSEFAARLMNSGIEAYNLRFKAICYHLYHNEFSREQLTDNDKTLQMTIETNLKWCNEGVDKYLAK